MADYILHLGFRWDGPAIGSILGNSAVLPNDARFLQLALADSGGVPSWFQFQSQDTMSVTIWDLSSTSAPPESGFALGLDMSFGPLDGGGQSTTINPATLLASDGYYITTEDFGKQSLVLRCNTIAPSNPPGDCPWGTWRACYAAGQVIFTNETSYELGCILTVSSQGTKQYFVADPEVIVGSGGAGGPSTGN